MNKITKKELAPFDEFKNQLTEFDKKYKDVVYDLTDPKEEKKARSDKFSIGKICSALSAVHKEIKAPYLAVCNEIDDLKNGLEKGFRNTQKDIGEQIKKHEAKIQAHKDMLFAKLSTIEHFLLFDSDNPTAADYELHIKELEQVVVDESYEHHQENALSSKDRVLDKLHYLFNEKKQAEADAQELIELRAKQAEQDKLDQRRQIEKQAVKQAEIDSQAKLDKLELEKAAAIKKAEDEKNAAIKKIQDDAIAKESARIVQEKINKDKRQALEIAENERQSNLQHRKEIHSQIKNDILNLGTNVNELEATKIVKSIINGTIKNLTINY
jgi:hypothetical protein